jgi:non-heme chloroperoxidase
MPYLETADGASLFYRDWGSGQPVVFLSSWGLSSVQFQYQMASLVKRGYRTISYDRRGHGRSDDPGVGYDYDTLADDLAALIDHLDLSGLTLVGHSMAGGEIVRYLSRHGDGRTARAVLVAATLPFPRKTETNPMGVEAAIFERVRELWSRDFAAWVQANEPPYFGDGLPGCDVSEFIRDWTRTDMLGTSLMAIIECNRALTDTDFRDELRTVRVPTLIVQGDKDASIPIELAGYRQHELLPNSQLIVYENAPHGLYLTHRDRLTEDLTAFIAGNKTNEAGIAVSPGASIKISHRT